MLAEAGETIPGAAAGAWLSLHAVLSVTAYPQMENSNNDTQPWLTRERVLATVFIAITALAVYLCVVLALPFIASLTWAMVLAILVQPAHRWITAKVKRGSLAAALTVVLAIVVLALPAVFVGRQVTIEASHSLQTLRTGEAVKQWRQAVERNQRFAPIVQWIEREVDLRAQLDRVSENVLRVVSNFLFGSLYAIIGWLITFYLLFFFLRDQEAILRWLRALMPLSKPETNTLFNSVRDTVFAIAFGTFTVSFVQGTLAGLMFWFVGLPAPLMWGAIMALLAMVPVLGAAMIWIPAAIYLMLQGEMSKALVLVGWGVAVVGLVDNLLYPLLVKGRMDLHPVPVFVAVIGGLVAFGATGIIFGPVILALALALLEVWRSRLAFGAAEETGGT